MDASDKPQTAWGILREMQAPPPQTRQVTRFFGCPRKRQDNRTPPKTGQVNDGGLTMEGIQFDSAWPQSTTRPKCSGMIIPEGCEDLVDFTGGWMPAPVEWEGRPSWDKSEGDVSKWADDVFQATKGQYRPIPLEDVFEKDGQKIKVVFTLSREDVTSPNGNSNEGLANAQVIPMGEICPKTWKPEKLEKNLNVETYWEFFLGEPPFINDEDSRVVPISARPYWKMYPHDRAFYLLPVVDDGDKTPYSIDPKAETDSEKAAREADRGIGHFIKIYRSVNTQKKRDELVKRSRRRHRRTPEPEPYQKIADPTKQWLDMQGWANDIGPDTAARDTWLPEPTFLPTPPASNSAKQNGWDTNEPPAETSKATPRDVVETSGVQTSWSPWSQEEEEEEEEATRDANKPSKLKGSFWKPKGRDGKSRPKPEGTSQREHNMRSLGNETRSLRKTTKIPIQVRLASVEDAGHLASIYNARAAHIPCVLDAPEMTRKRMEGLIQSSLDGNLPFIVAERTNTWPSDNSGRTNNIVGMAYLVHTNESSETSGPANKLHVFVTPRLVHKGVGTALVRQMLGMLGPTSAAAAADRNVTTDPGLLGRWAGRVDELVMEMPSVKGDKARWKVNWLQGLGFEFTGVQEGAGKWKGKACNLGRFERALKKKCQVEKDKVEDVRASRGGWGL